MDITEGFGDDAGLDPSDWVAPKPLNLEVPNPEQMGLPGVAAGDDEVYSIASQLSSVRDLAQVPRDGVYCPVCHIANGQLQRLGTPCPKCSRRLLRFGWD